MGNLDVIIYIEDFVREKGLPKTITIYDLLGELAEDEINKKIK